MKPMVVVMLQTIILKVVVMMLARMIDMMVMMMQITIMVAECKPPLAIGQLRV